MISPTFDFWPPRSRRPWCRRAGRPWGSAKNASMTKAVVISSVPQAPPWAPIGHCYSLGWPWGAALLPFLHAPPAPSTWAPTRAPPWPATGLRVLHDDFFELRVFLVHVTLRFKSSLVALAMLSWCVGGRGGRQRKWCTDNYGVRVLRVHMGRPRGSAKNALMAKAVAKSSRMLLKECL